MFNRSDLSKRADQIVDLFSKDEVNPDEANAALQELVGKAKRASKQERDEVVRRFSPLIPNLRIMRAAALAIGSGALVEQGASFEPMAEPTLTRFAEAAHGAIPFVEACRAMAKAEDAHTPNVAADEPEGEKQAESSPGHRESVRDAFGERVAEQMPDAARAFSALQTLWAASLAVLQRSKPLRRRFRESTAVIADLRQLEVLGVELPCLREMVMLLDDEEIIVLHPALHRGFIVRIASIGINFQLHTLLADALIGDVDTGWLPGERPQPEVIALAKDAPITDPDNLPHAFGAFNLWNWTGLRADGTLPDPKTEGQATGSSHWIWNEGIPADIVPFQGTRMILIGPAPYPRGWGAGRFFPGMAGELEVLRVMGHDEARDWLERIARAPKPEPLGRHISAKDVEGI